MPEMDGYQFLAQYRRESNVPVIIITAKDEETDAVLGLELGADDYIIKPFRMRELMARIRAVMRRTDQDIPIQKMLRSGDLTLDKHTHTVTRAGNLVHLTPIEFDLLEIVMSSPGQVFTRESLMERLSDSGFAGYERTINVHVRNLRAKIEIDPANPEFIETIFGVGYRFHKESLPE
jgi:two-component system alkaline phosphatase synthesis response regulator PhoP